MDQQRILVRLGLNAMDCVTKFDYILYLSESSGYRNYDDPPSRPGTYPTRRHTFDYNADPESKENIHIINEKLKKCVQNFERFRVVIKRRAELLATCIWPSLQPLQRVLRLTSIRAKRACLRRVIWTLPWLIYQNSIYRQTVRNKRNVITANKV